MGLTRVRDQTPSPYLVRTFKGTGDQMIWWPFESLEWRGSYEGHPAYARCHAKHENKKAFHVDVAWEHIKNDIQGHEFFPFSFRLSKGRVRSPLPEDKPPSPPCKRESYDTDTSAESAKKLRKPSSGGDKGGGKSGGKSGGDKGGDKKTVNVDTCGGRPESSKRVGKPRDLFSYDNN